ncbi:MAG: hypothetical protein ABF289_12845 [Clostridiales bacterium]
MSKDKININFDELDSALEKFNTAISKFEPYSKNFIKDTSSAFDGFNSDFIDKMKSLLDNMKDTKAPNLVKNSKEFYSITKQVVNDFKEMDNETAKKMKGEK